MSNEAVENFLVGAVEGDLVSLFLSLLPFSVSDRLTSHKQGSTDDRGLRRNATSCSNTLENGNSTFICMHPR